MKAIVQDRYGSPDVLALREIAMPAVAEDEVLVRVRAASAHPDVWHVLHGRPYVMRLAGLALRRPRHAVPGIDVAAPEAALAAKPERLSFLEAAAVPTSGLIALQGVQSQGRVQAGQSVLVNGAGGGVGTFAVQLAKAFGAHVTGVDVAAKLDMLAAIGADRVIDPAREDFARGRYDVIVDIPGTARSRTACARSRPTART